MKKRGILIVLIMMFAVCLSFASGAKDEAAATSFEGKTLKVIIKDLGTASFKTRTFYKNDLVKQYLQVLARPAQLFRCGLPPTAPSGLFAQKSTCPSCDGP